MVVENPENVWQNSMREATGMQSCICWWDWFSVPHFCIGNKQDGKSKIKS
jgi:hypothetical protein